MKFPAVVLEAVDALPEDRTTYQRQLAFWSERQMEIKEDVVTSHLSDEQQRRRTELRRLMVFFDPAFLFGKTVPQYLYTWSWSGIGMEYAWGIGVDLPKRFEFRYTGHPLMQRFGSRDQPLGPAWLGPNGPWGRYNTIGVRKYFGTRREGTY